MIIDAHTHIHEFDRGAHQRSASADDLVRAMDVAGIEWSVVLPVPGIAGNGFVSSECRRHSGRLVPLHCPDFTDHSTTLSKLVSAASEEGIRGLKIHPRMQDVSVRDSVLDDVAAWAADQQIPILFDVFPYGKHVANPDVRVLAYEPLARRHPKATIILAHAGGYQVLETFLLMKALDNVYFDVSFSFSYFAGSSVIQDLEFALRRAPAGRVLYGSDFPEVDSGEYLQLVRNHGRSLSEEQTQQLFSGAAATIFGIG
jgi:hypothetical protein